MRKLFSLSVLCTATVLSVATSELPEIIASMMATGPSVTLDAATPTTTFDVDVHAEQSAAGSFDGMVDVRADLVAAVGTVTVTGTLAVWDNGWRVLDTEQVAVTAGSDAELFLYEDLDAFPSCAAGLSCDAEYRVTFEAPSTVVIDWTFSAELEDRDALGRTGDVDVTVL